MTRVNSETNERYIYSAYSRKYPQGDPEKDIKPNIPGNNYYWGGGPFQNGTSALNMSWYDGFDPKMLFGLLDIGSPMVNPEVERPLNKAPKRTYYVNASMRLAALIDRIYTQFPNDTVAVVSHSQGTMIAALAMLFVKTRVPDALFLCNSPYSFDDKFTDGATMGGRSPTARSRIKTFFNILDRFQATHSSIAAKTTERQLEGVGGFLNIEPQDDCDARVVSEHGEEKDGPAVDPIAYENSATATRTKWTPEIPTEVPVKGREDHGNHGRVFIYCSPHDRVMGATPLRSIGWKGVPCSLEDPDNPAATVNPFEKYRSVLFQRQFMRGHSVGSTPDLNVAQTPRYPDDGRPLWIPPSPKVAGLLDEMAVIGRNEKIYVNAPRVPKPMPAGRNPRYALDGNAFTMPDDRMSMWDFNEDIDSTKKISQDSTFMYYKELLYDKRGWVTEKRDTPYGREERQRPATDDEVQKMLDETPQVPTNHSTILMYQQGELAKRILAYDLPIGRADSFEDEAFWMELIRMADWLESDPYYRQGGDFIPPPPPEGLDLETREIVQMDIERTRRLYGG